MTYRGSQLSGGNTMNTRSRVRRMAAVAVLGITAGGLTGLTACDRDRGTRVADADNTARNTRDRDERTATTPLDQGENEGDRTITQHIRKAVTSNDALSTNAHNVKIV